MKKYNYLLLLLLMAATNVAAQSLHYRFRHLTVDNGLSHTDATALAQDSKGFMWIGTYSGLNRYDGYSVKVFYHNLAGGQSAYLNRISDIATCSDNRLWLATEGGLALFDPTVESFLDLKADNAVTQSGLTKNMSKLVVVKDRLYTLSGSQVTAYRISAGQNITRLVDRELSRLNASDMKADRGGNLWIQHDGGLAVLPEKGKTIYLQFQVKPSAGSGRITAFLPHENGSLFVANETGLYKLAGRAVAQLLASGTAKRTINLEQFEKVIASAKDQSPPLEMVVDNNENIWLGSAAGLLQYNFQTTEKREYVFNEFYKTALSSNYITSLFVDRSQCLWLGTFGGGVNIADLNQKPFHLIQRVPLSNNTISGNYIRALFEDEDENLWIGTRNDGLNYFNFQTGAVTQYHPSNSGIASNHIRSLVKDRGGRLWIGTDVGISIRQPDGRFTNLRYKAGESATITGTNFFALAVDKFNQIWAGSWDNGLNRIRYEDGKPVQVERLRVEEGQKGLLSNRITFLSADEQRAEVLVGTDKGLNRIILNKDGSINRIDHLTGTGANTLSSEFVWPVVRQNDSLIWVGTLGGGLNRLVIKGNSYSIANITDNSSRALKDIESMLLDDSGDLWMAGKLLVKYSPEKNEFVYYDVNDGLQGNSFKIGAAHKGASGRMYFGGTNGVNYFRPEKISANTIYPSVTFTKLIVNGSEATFGATDDAFSRSIAYADKLELVPGQNSFSVQFSSMHFGNPESCKFRYKLKGLSENWIYTDAGNRFATYSNLDYGKYTLVVEASNNDGLWSQSGKQLSIVVLAPWWKTGFAKAIYLLLLIALIYLIWRYQYSLFDLKRKLQYRVLEEKKQEELHQMKLQFFTNISHEFRTPLTLILGPAEKMLQGEPSKEERQSYLRMVYSNARRLMGLINELMDFRQVETDSLKLLVKECCLDSLVQSIAKEFEELAIQREIDFAIRTNGFRESFYFDPNIVEKILINLLSNAFKYTGRGGEIEAEIIKDWETFQPTYKHHVHLTSGARFNDFVWVRIADTGIGITENSIQNIFDRYFRINTLGHEKHLGSGVGLALVRSLVELHKGELHVYSERNRGTEFLVGLPLKKEGYKKLEISDDTEHQIDFESLQYTIDWINSEKESEDVTESKTVDGKRSGGRRKILIVEDNVEMRRFLRNSLQPEYEIVEADNGQQGLEQLKQSLPDLVLSDLMMPVMDGIEFCRTVRSDIEISHVPFILITAKSSSDTQLEGIECGADVYFPKPFSLRLLQGTLRNLFERMDKLKAKYNQDVFAEARELVSNNKDKEFLDELIAIIEANMEDEELDVEMLCRKICMSRTKLYGKIKSVTGQPIGEFVRVLRLKKAAKILASEDVAVVEAMYRVGIKSQSYFTKAFKKEFGMTPTQFVSNLSAKKDE